MESDTPLRRNESFLKKDVGMLFIVSRRLQTSERGGAAVPINEDQHGPAVWTMDAVRLRRMARLEPYRARVRVWKWFIVG